MNHRWATVALESHDQRNFSSPSALLLMQDIRFGEQSDHYTRGWLSFRRKEWGPEVLPEDQTQRHWGDMPKVCPAVSLQFVPLQHYPFVC